MKEQINMAQALAQIALALKCFEIKEVYAHGQKEYNKYIVHKSKFAAFGVEWDIEGGVNKCIISYTKLGNGNVISYDIALFANIWETPFKGYQQLELWWL